METENSFQYFRGREAMGRGEARDSCTRLRGLSRAAWLKGWDDEAALRGQQRQRTPEEEAEAAEARAWLANELENWKKEQNTCAK